MALDPHSAWTREQETTEACSHQAIWHGMWYVRHPVSKAACMTAMHTVTQVTHEAYGKLARLHREHAPSSEATAAATAPADQQPGTSAGGADDGPATAVPETHWEALAADAEAAAGGTSRVALHRRLFALLLRYKSIQGHGFQVSS